MAPPVFKICGLITRHVRPIRDPQFSAQFFGLPIQLIRNNRLIRYPWWS